MGETLEQLFFKSLLSVLPPLHPRHPYPQHFNKLKWENIFLLEKKLLTGEELYYTLVLFLRIFIGLTLLLREEGNNTFLKLQPL